MTRSDLVEELAARFGQLTHRDAEFAVKTLLDAMSDALVRGQRHTMLNDSDIHSTRHARAVVGGVLASVVGQGALYVSGGAEHQGPAGGGPLAAIVRVPEVLQR